MEKVRWGILGCADIVERRFLPSLTGECNNGVLQAIASKSRGERMSRMAGQYQPPKIYEEYEQLLADVEVDAVYIPLPNGLHVEWTIKALQAKKHVLCEKPMAVSVREIELIRTAAAENGVNVMEAFACLHSPLYPTIRELIAKGEIGQLRIVDSVFCYCMDEGSINASRELLGGSINDIGCYNLLTIRQLTGREPVCVKAMAVFLPTGVDGTVTALLDMGGDVTGCYKSSLLSVSHRGLYALGDEGYISFPKTPNTWGELSLTLSSLKYSKTIPLTVPNPYALEIVQMGRCILEGETPLVTLDESSKNARALEMLHTAIGEP